MNPDQLQAIATELHQLLQLREDVTRNRNETDDNEEQDRLSSLIRDINENQLPDLRERIRDVSNAEKGSTKHQLLELTRKVDVALMGVGTFREIDVSEARLNSLRKHQVNARSHREAKEIGNEIRTIERARSLWKEQKRLLANEQSRREQMDSETRRIDEILYGHLQKKN
jgi:hypothetical protein